MPLIDLANPSRFVAFADRVLPWLTGATVLVFLAAIVMSVLNGEWKARRSQREIDALDSLAGDL